MADEDNGNPIYNKIIDRETEMGNLFARMDVDRDLYWLETYKMKKEDGQEYSKNVVHNVTLNDPSLFAFRAISNLNAAHEQIVVKGADIDDKQASYIEDFLHYVLNEIDERLNKLGMVSLSAFENEQLCIRGRMAARCFLRKHGDSIIPDVRPLDTRYVVYQEGVAGIPWYSYNTYRSKYMVKEEYGIDCTNDTPIVRDYWGRKDNIVYVDEVEAKKRPNRLGYPPLVYAKTCAGSMLADPNNIQHDGESLFAQDRAIWPELNAAASVLKTIHMRSFSNAVQLETEDPKKDEPPEQNPSEELSVTMVGKGMGFKAMPVNDMRAAARHFLAMLEARAQRGALPAVNYGNLTFPLSGAAVAQLTEAADAVYIPRLMGKAMFRRQLCKMIINQFVAKGMPTEFGKDGDRRRFEPEKLKGDYEISFRYYSQSPMQTIANFTIGAAAHAGGISKRTIFTDIYKLENVEEEIMFRAAEDAEELDPVLKLYNHVHKLIDMDNPQANVQAWILARRVVAMLRQRRMGVTPTEPVGSGGNGAKAPAPLLPLLNGSGGGRANPEMQSEEERTASEEEDREQMAQINRTRREGEKID